VTDRTSDLVDVAPNSTASAEAPCDVSVGEKVTGGGFAFSSVRIVVVDSFAIGNEWHIFAFNPSPDTGTQIQAHAQCTRLVP